MNLFNKPTRIALINTTERLLSCNKNIFVNQKLVFLSTQRNTYLHIVYAIKRNRKRKCGAKKNRKVFLLLTA